MAASSVRSSLRSFGCFSSSRSSTRRARRSSSAYDEDMEGPPPRAVSVQSMVGGSSDPNSTSTPNSIPLPPSSNLAARIDIFDHLISTAENGNASRATIGPLPPSSRPSTALGECDDFAEDSQPPPIRFSRDRDLRTGMRDLWLWSGCNTARRPYRGFESDEYLFFQDGDRLIHFDADDDPTFVVHSQRLEQSGLPYLVFLNLRASEILDKQTLNFQRRADNGTIPPSRRLSSIQLPHASSSQSLTPLPRKINFPTPHLRAIDFNEFQRRVTFRNILATLYAAPLVGLPGQDFFQVLKTLTKAVVRYGSKEADFIQAKCVAKTLYSYIHGQGYLDIGGNVDMGFQILAWCEYHEVEWVGGWIKVFANLIAIMEEDSFSGPTYEEYLSEESKNMLEEAWQNFSYYRNAAEVSLAEFEFPDLLAAIDPEYVGVRQAYQGFQRIVLEYYTTTFGAWPPNRRRHWLTRTLIQQLEDDFSDLYDALVDLDITWQEVEESTRHNSMALMQHWTGLTSKSRSHTPTNLHHQLTRAVTNFDQRMSLPHMALPAPMLPERSIAKTASNSRRFLTRVIRMQKEPPLEESQKAATAYESCTRDERFANGRREHGPLYHRLVNHEREYQLPGISMDALQDARLGRWLLIYGVLQTLMYNRSRRWEEDSLSGDIWESLYPYPPWRVQPNQALVDHAAAYGHSHGRMRADYPQVVAGTAPERRNSRQSARLSTATWTTVESISEE